MPSKTHVRVVHSRTGQEWDCPLPYLARAREKGYHAVDEPGPYDDQTIEDLKSQIDSRNADRDEDDQLSKAGNKADLIATLIADDGRRS